MGSTLLLVGCGKMGQALLGGWLSAGQVSRCLVVEPQPVPLPDGAVGIVSQIQDTAAIPPDFTPDAIVLAVKPQVMADVLPAYRRFAGQALFLSIAAGKTIASFEGSLGAAAIVRAMPNTPAAVGRGISVACANERVDQAARGLAESLLSAVGEVAWAADEALMDAVTAVSGSGPAYVFLLAEVLAAAGVAAGLPADLAQRLARVTVAGSGELLHRSAEPAAQLRQNVTSPNGTTAAALAVLMAQPGLQDLMEKAVAAATRRSRELAG
jgi:pyrroline-5-carboxylate reductase